MLRVCYGFLSDGSSASPMLQRGPFRAPQNNMHARGSWFHCMVFNNIILFEVLVYYMIKKYDLTLFNAFYHMLYTYRTSVLDKRQLLKILNLI